MLLFIHISIPLDETNRSMHIFILLNHLIFTLYESELFRPKKVFENIELQINFLFMIFVLGYSGVLICENYSSSCLL